jgi:hypothetical protein
VIGGAVINHQYNSYKNLISDARKLMLACPKADQLSLAACQRMEEN